MSRMSKIPPALKHGIYSATAVLPGEDPGEFAKLHRALVAELAPNGALEEDIVATTARLVWRKQNLATLRAATRAQSRFSEIMYEMAPSELSLSFPLLCDSDPARREEQIRAAHEEARKELGAMYRFVEIGKAATSNGLLEDLELEERLDGLIDKCLKRLLFLRGLKSISASSSASSAPQARISRPSKAA
jgi:hypothetical protein